MTDKILQDTCTQEENEDAVISPSILVKMGLQGSSIYFVAVDGRECVVLQKSKEGNSPSSDYFYMHSAHCRENHMFICELTDPLVAPSGRKHRVTSSHGDHVTPLKVSRVKTNTNGTKGVIGFSASAAVWDWKSRYSTWCYFVKNKNYYILMM